jgi:hypothetical protein
MIKFSPAVTARDTYVSNFSFLGKVLLIFSLLLSLDALLISSQGLNAQVPYATETMGVGSVVIDMGQVPQTLNNTLKGYGLLTYITSELNIPVKWVINPSKAKDGIDFTVDGIDYRGGPFVISSEFATPTLIGLVNNWNTNNAGGALNIDVTATAVSMPVYNTITYYPTWTLNEANSQIAETYITNAGITASSYNSKDPEDLDGCDQLFAMPHADPVWDTHSNLYYWNRDHNGGIWAACHAVSALENLYDKTTPNVSLQMNFLSEKRALSPGITGGDDLAKNTLIFREDHADGSGTSNYINRSTEIVPGPLAVTYNAHPNMQFMGLLDGSQENGSEHIYMPYTDASWRTTTAVAIYDPLQSNVVDGDSPGEAAKLLFGEAFGDSGRGNVMYAGGHKLNNASAPANVAAQRTFHNFSLWALEKTKVSVGDISPMTTLLIQGDMETFTTSPAPTGGEGSYNYTWTVDPSSAGSFDNSSGVSPEFTAVSGATYPLAAVITVVVTGNCATNVGYSSIPITITAGPPGITTNPESEIICEDYCLDMIDVIGNDIFVCTTAPFTVTVTSVSPANERVTVNPDNTLKYWPSIDSDGTVTVTYQVCDAMGTCSATDGTLTITVEADACGAGETCLPGSSAPTIAYGLRGKDGSNFASYNFALDAWTNLTNLPKNGKEGASLSVDENYVYYLVGNAMVRCRLGQKVAKIG